LNITLHNTGKRFNREWIFRNLNYNFLQGQSYAITGFNGSGKSTLLQIIAGASMHSEGEINYTLQTGSEKQQTANNKQSETTYQQIAIAAPYLELIEEMTANEFLAFHAAFKSFTSPYKDILTAVGLEKSAEKQIRYYSSGMKQRLKLAQAFFSNTSVLLLDEPTTNLDEDGIAIYRKLWSENTANRLVIVSSNDKKEYENCSGIIFLGDYK
jgi:ABC-type multidrug transport system ATPase subunit